ncbi:MAG: hypothetical protein M1839_003263 [Geoglossum umbratile]|nr:MAG: hypothetical protein M1839_003263 [Geoglossum umbratile]
MLCLLRIAVILIDGTLKLITTLLVVLANAENFGSYTWNIGAGDGINEKELSVSPNFVLRLTDPTGRSSTGNPTGFVDNVLSSRGFVIKSNITSHSSTSTTASTPLASTSPAPSVLPMSTIASAAAASAPGSGLNTAAKAGIGTGVGVVGVAALIAAWAFFLQRRSNLQLQRKLQQNSQAEEANTGLNLHAHPATRPECSELSSSKHFLELSRSKPLLELSSSRHVLELSAEPPR